MAKDIKKQNLKKEVAEPTTMEELLASSGYELSVPKKGETIKGLVTGITRKMVMVDVGAKTEGIVAEREYDFAREFIETMKVGDEGQLFESVNAQKIADRLVATLHLPCDIYQQNQIGNAVHDHGPFILGPFDLGKELLQRLMLLLRHRRARLGFGKTPRLQQEG